MTFHFLVISPLEKDKNEWGLIYREGHISQKCWHATEGIVLRLPLSFIASLLSPDFTDVFTTRPNIYCVAFLAKILQYLRKAMKDSQYAHVHLLIRGYEMFRSSCPEVLCKKGVLRNFAKFTGKFRRRLQLYLK